MGTKAKVRFNNIEDLSTFLECHGICYDIDTDNEGQVIVYTGLYAKNDDTLTADCDDPEVAKKEE